MSPAAGAATTAHPALSARQTVPWPGVGEDRRRSAASSSSRRASRPAWRCPAPRRRGDRQAAVGRGEHADRPAGQALERRAQQPVLAVLGGRRRDEHDRPGRGRRRRSTRSPRRLPLQRADDVGVGARRTAGRGYSSCGNVPTRHSSREIPPCTWSSGGRPRRPRVSLSSRRPSRSPPAEGGADAVPHPPPGAGPRQPRPDRVRSGSRAPGAGRRGG